jgi:hypothetical protein
MKHKLFLWALLVGQTMAFGQANMPPTHDHADVIDGSITPDLISDSTAWRLWLIAVTTEDNGKPELSEPRRRAFLKQAGIKDSEFSLAEGALAQFKSDYAALIDNYNKRVSAGDNPDLADFIAQREALVQASQTILMGKLGTESVANFKSHIQAEKAHMKVSKGVQ